MKQIEEVDSIAENKYFLTPKKNKQCPKKPLQLKRQEDQIINQQNKLKFDLGQSPRFKKGSEQISALVQSSQRKFISSQRKPYSPIIIKKQEKQQSTSRKVPKSHNILQISDNLRNQQNLSKCYDSIIKKIKLNQQINFNNQTFTPSIIDKYDQGLCKFSQLMTYQLNHKNSRSLVYDQEKQTVISIYECLGCNKIYKSASALGGHMRTCSLKQIHYFRLDSLRKGQNYSDQLKNYQELDNQEFDQEENIQSRSQKRQRKFYPIHNNNVFYSSEQNQGAYSHQGSQQNKRKIFKIDQQIDSNVASQNCIKRKIIRKKDNDV